MSALLVAGCDQPENQHYRPTASDKPVIANVIVGIHPLHNPQRLMEAYGPIVDLMNTQIPDRHFVLEASRDYAEFEQKLYAGHFDFAMPNPYQTIESVKHGYRIFGKMGDDNDFRGIIVVRKDAGIKSLADLKGKVVAYPAPTALAATMMPQYFMFMNGLDINHDIENSYVGSQESAIMNTYRKLAAAGSTWPIPWKKFVIDHPEMAAEMEVKWQTEPLVNNGWVVRNDVPAELAKRFAEQLFHLHENPQGRAILKELPIRRFEPANEATYQPVKVFLETFTQKVRPLND